MLCSREEVALKNVFVNILVGTKQPRTKTWFKENWLEMLFEGGMYEQGKKTSNFPILQICFSTHIQMFSNQALFFFFSFSA